jgi:hypothetical protein
MISSLLFTPGLSLDELVEASKPDRTAANPQRHDNNRGDPVAVSGEFS